MRQRTEVCFCHQPRGALNTRCGRPARRATHIVGPKKDGGGFVGRLEVQAGDRHYLRRGERRVRRIQICRRRSLSAHKSAGVECSEEEHEPYSHGSRRGSPTEPPRPIAHILHAENVGEQPVAGAKPHGANINSIPNHQLATEWHRPLRMSRVLTPRVP